MRAVIKALSLGETDTDKLVSLVHKRTINKHGKDTIKAASLSEVSKLQYARSLRLP